MLRFMKWVSLTAVLLIWLPVPRLDMDREEQFSLELSLCKEAAARNVPGQCALFGKIQVVDSFPDVKVQVVESFPDIKVQWVNAFPTKPGQWQSVSSFPDYKVQFVQSFPDYKIQFVESFPGCR